MPSQRIELIARGVLKSGSSILICWSSEGNYGYLPGGHVEFGESAAEALVRECNEEFGESVQAGPLLLIQEQHFEQLGRSRHEVTLVFHVEHALSAPKSVVTLEPHLEFLWMDLSVIASRDIRPEATKRWLVARGHLSTNVSWIPSRAE